MMEGAKINMQETHNSLTRRAVFSNMSWLFIFSTNVFYSKIWASKEFDSNLEDHKARNTSEGSNIIMLHMPNYAYDGSRVPFSVEVNSPMTKNNYVRQVHILSEHNPFPRIATFHFTPQSGKAFVRTRIRLSKSQHVIAVAELNDGSIFTNRKWIEVTINGCKED